MDIDCYVRREQLRGFLVEEIEIIGVEYAVNI
jgi:hypothetical protein